MENKEAAREKALKVEGSRKDTYDCAMCGETYNKGWDDSEAMEEFGENYKEVAADDMAVICDDCYNIVMNN